MAPRGSSPSSVVHAALINLTSPDNKNTELLEYYVTWNQVNLGANGITISGTQRFFGSPPNTTNLRVLNLTNGQQYTFAVKARNKRGYGEMSPESAEVDIIPGRLFTSRMGITSDVAGVTVDVTLTFETTAMVPNSGSLQLKLPNSFPNVTSALSVDLTVVSVTATETSYQNLAYSFWGRSVNVLLDATTGIPAASNMTLVLRNIQNPQISGYSGRLELLATLDWRGDPLDEASIRYNTEDRVPGRFIIPGNFSGQPQVDFSSNEAGDVAQTNITCVLANPLPPLGLFRINFPAGIANISRATVKMVEPDFEVLSVNATGQELVAQRRGFRQSTLSDGSRVRLVIDGIVLPSFSVHLGHFESFRTENSNGTVIDEASREYHEPVRPAGIFVIPGRFTSSPVVVFATQLAGARGDAEITFGLKNPLPGDGRIVIHFPETTADIAKSEFTDLYRNISGSHVLLETVHTNVSNHTVTLSRPGTGPVLRRYTSLYFVVRGVQNLQHEGQTGSFPVVRTKISGGAPIDEASKYYHTDNRAPTIEIFPGRFLSPPTLNPGSNLAGAETFVVLNFTNKNPIPGNGFIYLTLPGGSHMDFTSISSPVATPLFGISGIVATEYNHRTGLQGGNLTNTWNISMQVSPNRIEEATNVSIKITGIKLPVEAGTTRRYPMMRTTLSDASTSVDETSLEFNSRDMIARSDIIPGRFYNASFTSETNVIGGFGYVDFRFVLDNPVPTLGSIIFEVSSWPACFLKALPHLSFCVNSSRSTIRFRAHARSKISTGRFPTDRGLCKWMVARTRSPCRST